MKLSAGIAAALLCSTCLSGVAHAQTMVTIGAPTDEGQGGWGGGGVLTLPPPIRLPADVNGVDLSTGAFSYSVKELSIGSGAGELTYARSYLGAGWRDNQTGTINSSDGVYVVSIGGRSESFTLTAGQYVSDQGAGSTLAFDNASQTYTYRSSTGDTAIFSKALAGSSPTEANEGRITSLTSPSGVKLTYAYKQVTPVTGVTAQRLQSVTNNFGYQLKFTYQSNSGTNSTVLTKVTGVNLAVDYCDPAADTCSNFTVAWPSVTYSGNTVTDALGRVTTYGYAGGLSTIQAPGRATVTVGYNLSGQVMSVSNGIGTWGYGYAGGVTTVTDPLSHQRKFTVDATNGLMTVDQDALGRSTTYTFDAQYRPKRITGPDGGYTEVQYDARGNITESRRVAAPGSGTVADIVVSASYDATCSNVVTCNLPNFTTDERGGQTDYTYDPVHGGVLTVTKPPVNVAPGQTGVRPQMRYQYSSLNASYKNSATTYQSGSPVYQVTSVSACNTLASCSGGADETKTTVAYAHNNLLPTSVSSGAGNAAPIAVTALTYNPVGDLLTVDGPLAGTADTTRYRYDALRRQIGVVGPDPDGAGALKYRATRLTYHANGAVSSVEQGTVADQGDTAWNAFAVLRKTTTDYDTIGRPVTQSLVAGGATQAVAQQSYDAANRLTCDALRMVPGGTLPASACTLSTAGADGPDRINKYDYNNADQPTAIAEGFGTSSAGVSVAATYDAATGRMTTLADGKGNLTTYEYDRFGRVAKVRYPSASNGAISSVTDYEQYSYDAASHVTQVRRRDGQLVGVSYDAAGNATLMDMPASLADVSYTYDNAGRLLTASAGGQTNSFGYDALGRNVSQSGPRGTVAYQYDAAGRRTRITWPDAFWVSYDYDLADGLTAVREAGAVSGPGVLATLVYDDLGRRTSLTRGNGAVTSYTYDAASRLGTLTHDLAGTANDVAYTFAYNGVSEIKSRTISNNVYEPAAPATVDRVYQNNGLNQLTTSGTLSLAYDGRGNLASDGVNTYGYDPLNRLTSASAATLAYDPLGRLSEVVGASTTRFAYDGVNLIGEYDAAGTLLRRYVPGAGMDEPLVWYEGAGSTDRRWLAADQLGSVVAVTNGAAGLAAANKYDEYGVPSAGNLGRFQYTGQTFIPEIGLYHYKARAYSPQLGRFLQPDPIGYADGLNLYAYVGNDPLNFTDPLGLARVGDLIPRDECDDYGGQIKQVGGVEKCMLPGIAVSMQLGTHSGGDGSTAGGGGDGGVEDPGKKEMCRILKARVDQTKGALSSYQRNSWRWNSRQALAFDLEKTGAQAQWGELMQQGIIPTLIGGGVSGAQGFATLKGYVPQGRLALIGRGAGQVAGGYSLESALLGLVGWREATVNQARANALQARLDYVTLGCKN